MTDTLTSADTWRLVSATVATLVLFGLVVALARHHESLARSWRWVIVAVTAQQAVLAYIAVVRAEDTPQGLPDARVDNPLVILVLSSVALLVAVVGVFMDHRHPHGSA